MIKANVSPNWLIWSRAARVADPAQIDHQHRNALARLEKSAELTRQRQEANEARKERQRIQSSIIEGANAKELMELQHELNKENRLLDHQFALAEDARELERFAVETTIRQRDDYIRHMWDNDSEILALELKVIEMLIERQSKASLSALEHSQAKDMANHNTKLEKDLLKYKQDLLLEYKKKSGEVNDEAIDAHLDRLFRDGKIS